MRLRLLERQLKWTRLFMWVTGNAWSAGFLFLLKWVVPAGSSLWLACDPLTHSLPHNRLTSQVHIAVHPPAPIGSQLIWQDLVWLERSLCQFYNILTMGKYDKCKGTFCSFIMRDSRWKSSRHWVKMVEMSMHSGSKVIKKWNWSWST